MNATNYTLWETSHVRRKLGTITLVVVKLALLLMVSYYDGYDNCSRHLLPIHRAVTVIGWLKDTTLIMIMI